MRTRGQYQPRHFGVRREPASSSRFLSETAPDQAGSPPRKWPIALISISEKIGVGRIPDFD
jgi:hypothetical protein